MVLNINRIGIPYGVKALSFNPSSIEDSEGNLLLSQQLLTKQAPTIDGVVFDESKNKGDARPVQLRQFRNLNGSTQYGQVPDNPNLDITNNLSVVVWAKNDEATISASEMLLGKYNAGLDFREWRITVDSGEQVRVDFGNPADGLFAGTWESTNTITTNSVNTIGFTFASGTFIVYINGVAFDGTTISGTIPSTLFNSPANLTIGSVISGASVISPWDGDIYEARIYDTTVLTADEMLAIHNNPTGHAPVGARNVAHYKLDNNVTEEIIDSSGNGNDGAWVNAPTKSTGGAVHSWANDWGYTLGTGSNGYASGVFIPRNEAIPTQDVAGNPLQFTGRVPYNAQLTQSNAITLDGTSQYVAVSGMTATDNYFGACTISATINVNSVASTQAIWSLGASAYRLFINTTWRLNAFTDTEVTATTGTHRVSVTYNSAGRAISFSLNGVVVWTGTSSEGFSPTTTFFIGTRDSQGTPGIFFGGQVYNFSLTGSSVKNFSFNGAEGGGNLLYDKSGGNNHGTLINAPTVTKQDRFHSNLVEGFNKYLYLSGNTGGVRLPIEYQALVEGKGRIDFEYDIILQENPANAGTVHTIPIRSSPFNLVGFETSIETTGQPTVGGRSLSTESFRSITHSQSIPLNVKTTVRVYIDYTNQEGGISINGGAYETTTLGFITPTFTRENTNTSTFGSRYESNLRLRGIISNCKLHSNGEPLAEYDGYGNTDADWVATFGGSSINGTVLDSPSNIDIPALNSTTAVTGEPLRNPAGAYHNGAETLIDFTNGVLSPEAVINSWEDDWAFNDARTNPEFKRTLTQDGIDHKADRFLAYREELDGSNLTKVNKYVETKEVS